MPFFSNRTFYQLRSVSWLLIFGLLLSQFLAPLALPRARAVSTGLVISQVYGGGGNSGAPYQNDFIELFNLGTAPVSLAGWSVQYAPASGDFSQKTNLPALILNPGQYFLIQEAAGSTSGLPALPTPDVPGSINLGSTAGKVALVNNATTLGCGGTTTCTSAQMASIVDLVGYGSTGGSLPNEGGTSAAAPSNTSSALRGSNGCLDSDKNNQDFGLANPPTPRNSTSPYATCGGNAPIVPTCGPASLTTQPGQPATRNLSATDADNAVNNVTASVVPTPATGSISLTSLVLAGSAGGTLTATLAVSANLAPGSYTVTLTFTNNSPAAQTAACVITVSSLVPIYTIQGAAHRSPLEGQTVTTEGVVTGVKSNGFFIQDATGDNNPATSDAIFVFTGSSGSATLGNSVRVTGKVQEFVSNSRPDDAPLTEIAGSPTVVDLGAGPAITPITISTDPARTGPTIRKPPSLIFNAASPSYDPTVNGLDFYESLEGMLVQVDNALVVGPTSSNNDFVVVPDNGVGASGLTSRGGIGISATDFNPERIYVDNSIAAIPQVVVGDRLTVSIVGPLDYASSNFRIQTLSPITIGNVNTSQRATQETILPVSNPDQLRIASYNIENFNRLGANAIRLVTVADQIRLNLAAPDILVLCEVQDDTGPTSDGTVSADQNLNALRDAISSAGGPLYSYRYISPQDGQDGGQPGGNIRQVFFFRTDRGVSFVDKPGATATTANSVNSDGSLLYSPGRIDPTNSVFSDSRKPLAGEFYFKGQRLILIGNHLNSKLGDNPLYGSVQPPVLDSETKRRSQTTIIRQFVSTILTNDPNAFVLVAGDMNDFEFARPLNILKNNEGALTGNQVLTDVVESSDVAGERYTYIFEGNSQVIDHILYSQTLAPKLVKVDIVHLNADFNASASTRGSDHEAVTALFNLNAACNDFYVTSPGDGSTCGTLRNALTKATSPTTITFQPGLEVRPSSALPAVANGVKLDGGCTTDPATGRGVPGARLNGIAIVGLPTVGLALSGNNTVNGLAIVNFSDFALDISGSSNRLTCSWLGTADGQTKQPNGGGLRFKANTGNTSIGVAGDKSSGNLISGNTGYAVLDNANGSTANRFYFNLFGYSRNGILPLRNNKGLKLGASHFIFGTGNRVGI